MFVFALLTNFTNSERSRNDNPPKVDLGFDGVRFQVTRDITMDERRVTRVTPALPRASPIAVLIKTGSCIVYVQRTRKREEYKEHFKDLFQHSSPFKQAQHRPIFLYSARVEPRMIKIE
mgnify:CR=1 FL=1